MLTSRRTARDSLPGLGRRRVKNSEDLLQDRVEHVLDNSSIHALVRSPVSSRYSSGSRAETCLLAGAAATPPSSSRFLDFSSRGPDQLDAMESNRIANANAAKPGPAPQLESDSGHRHRSTSLLVFCGLFVFLSLVRPRTGTDREGFFSCSLEADVYSTCCELRTFNERQHILSRGLKAAT
ncbi:hypothetical protein BV20DRAFT_110821 [Pilatotrama ljubarskyi]|nr:hypothetical protein BV20DRAFT_110821 [Pilatotrama ljubarskyi]